MSKKVCLLNVNPIVKTILIMILTTANTLAYSVLAKFLVLFISIIAVSISGPKIKLSGLKNIIIFIIVSFMSNVFVSSGLVISKIGFLNITDQMLQNFFLMFSSMTSFWAMSIAMINSVSSSDIPYVAEFLLYPLKLFHVNVSEISMIITLVMRFIPLVLKESKNIIIAQESRGAEISKGSIFKRIKFIIPVFIPIFISCFRRATNIATAMECRCYGAPFNRTNLKQYHVKKLDIMFIIIVLMIFCGVMICNTVKIF